MAKETKILQIKRGSTTDWGNEASPLRVGELGYDTTTKEMKCGDGATAFASLPALGSGGGGGEEVFTSAETYYVGVGGGEYPTADYATLNEALEDLAKKRIGLPSSAERVEAGDADIPGAYIILLPGYAIDEPVWVKGIDLSWIRIIPALQQEESGVPVNIDSDAIAEFPHPSGVYGAVFSAWGGGALPKISGQYKFTYANPEDKPYLAFMTLSSARGEMEGATYDPWNVVDCNDIPFYVSNGSCLTLAAYGQILGSGYDAIVAESGSYVQAESVEIQNCVGDEIILSSGNSYVNFSRGAINGYDANSGVHAVLGGRINLEGALVIKVFSENPDEDDESITDIVVASGGIVYATDSLAGLSQAPNTVTAGGIIFKEIEEP